MARLVVSARSEKVKMLLDGILTLPMVLPPTVAGFFLLMIFGVKRPLGQLFMELFGVKIVFSWAATVIAAVAISFPLMYRAARGAFEQGRCDAYLCGSDAGIFRAAFSGR